MSEHSSDTELEKRPGNNNLIFAVVIVIIVACVAAFIFLQPDDKPTQVVEDVVIEETPMAEYNEPAPNPK